MKRIRNSIALLLACYAGTLLYAEIPKSPASLPNTQILAAQAALQKKSPASQAALTGAIIRAQNPSLVRSGINAVSPILNAYQSMPFNALTGFTGLGNMTKIPLAFALGKMGYFAPTPGQSNYEKFSVMVNALMTLGKDKILASIPGLLSHYVTPGGAVARALDTLNPTQSFSNVLWGSGSAWTPFRWAIASSPTWSAGFSQVSSVGGDWLKRSTAQLIAWGIIMAATAYALNKIGEMANLTNDELKNELITARNAILPAQMASNPESGILSAEQGLQLQSLIAEYADLIAAFGERNSSLNDTERLTIQEKLQAIVMLANSLLTLAIPQQLKNIQSKTLTDVAFKKDLIPFCEEIKNFHTNIMQKNAPFTHFQKLLLQSRMSTLVRRLLDLTSKAEPVTNEDKAIISQEYQGLYNIAVQFEQEQKARNVPIQQQIPVVMPPKAGQVPQVPVVSPSVQQIATKPIYRPAQKQAPTAPVTGSRRSSTPQRTKAWRSPQRSRSGMYRRSR